MTNLYPISGNNSYMHTTFQHHHEFVTSQDGLYGVYAEVGKFREWIDETIKDKDTNVVFCI